MKVTICLILSMFLLTACGSKDETTPPAETTQPPTAMTTESTEMATDDPETTESYLEILLPEDNMKDPYGVAVNSLGHIYVTDSGNNRVLIFDAEGNLVGKWDKEGSEDGAFKSMGFGGIAIDAADQVFVVDNGNHRIHI